jgi:hypothetical protein
MPVQDKLIARTAIDRGPPGELPIELDQNRPEILPEAGGDSSANEMDANIGGAPASAGLDSGGAVGVRRGRAVGRPGSEYDDSPAGETSSDLVLPEDMAADEVAPDDEDQEVDTEDDEDLLLNLMKP